MSRKRLWWVYLMYFLLGTGIIGYGSTYLFAYDSVDVVGTTDKYFRLHVLANSDSVNDQQIKLKVRDAVVTYLTPKLEQVKTLTDAQKIIKMEKDNLAGIAQSIVAGENVDYRASVQIGEYSFPQKSYGELVLPAGKYQAVQIVLGEGEGKNWWCVLFPPLCFVDVTQVTGVVAKGTGLPQAPTEVKYTWKIVEILQKHTKEAE